MRKLWVAGLCLWVGCASAPVKRAEPVVNLDAVDLGRLQGCYDCLLEARDAYQKAAVGRVRPLAVLRWFETELLIALREKELALDPSAAIARARALVPEIPPATGADRYLEDVERIPPEGAGSSRSEIAAFRLAHREFVAKVDEELLWIRSGAIAPAVAEYIAMALDCGYPTRTRPAVRIGPSPGAEPPAADAPPLLRYRAATCGRVRGDALERVRADVPRFVETSYVLGQIAVGRIAEGGGPNPHTLVGEVQERFPESPAVILLAGRLQQAVGDCETAIALYDRAIALKPRHEDAWLNRVICLTELRQAEDAIVAATRIVAFGLDNTDYALYWRAWNRHALGELDLARADIDASRRMRLTAEVLTLAGVIEHDQDELTPAESDLRRALDRQLSRNCRAEWYLGSVFAKRQTWRDAAVTFDRAMHCYEDDVRLRELLLGEIEKKDELDPEFKRRQTARLREDIRSQRHQRFAAAVNAANFHLAIGNLERAKALVDVAAAAPEFSSELASLRERLDELVAARRARGSGIE